MRKTLEAMSTSRLLDRLRSWSLHHADAAMARDDQVQAEATVLDRERAVHRWPVSADWLAGDAAGAASLRERLPERMRAVGGVAFALTMPAWMAPDGSIWILDRDQADADLEEIVVVGVGDRRVRELHVGAVHHRPSGGVGPWDKVRLGEPDPMLGPLGRALADQIH